MTPLGLLHEVVTAPRLSRRCPPAARRGAEERGAAGPVRCHLRVPTSRSLGPPFPSVFSVPTGRFRRLSRFATGIGLPASCRREGSQRFPSQSPHRALGGKTAPRAGSGGWGALAHGGMRESSRQTAASHLGLPRGEAGREALPRFIPRIYPPHSGGIAGLPGQQAPRGGEGGSSGKSERNRQHRE